MKAVGIIGFKNSGKTHLVKVLAGALSGEGHKVGIVKHAHGRLNVVEKDRALYACCRELTVISDKETGSLRRGSADLEDIISETSADLVLVEGFKLDKTLPRIICYKDLKEKKQLSTGLEIGFVKIGELTAVDVKKLAAAVRRKAFKLPGINCGKCGFKTCFGLAKEIVKGKRAQRDCAYALASARVRIAGKRVAVNPFVGKALANVVRGFLQSLKGGQTPGRIEIRIDGRPGKFF